MNEYVRPDRQVKAMARKPEITESGGPSNTIRIIKGQRAYSGASRGISVFTSRKACGQTCLLKGNTRSKPLIPRKSVADDRTVRSVEVSGVVLICGVGLDLSKVREHLLEAPLVVTP
jgi:hypothetical protein